MVQDKNDKQRASNLLGIVNNNIHNISEYMYNNLINNNNNNYIKYKPYILKLKTGINNLIIRESDENSKYTSYTVNKGEQVILCIRSKLINKYKNNGNIHNINLIMYVVLHEISHIACPEYGHTPLFREIFNFFCNEASNIGIYKKIDFKITPMEYCGMTITG
jgi:predicted metal-dependent hydrolase